jgi:hypothetical protein
MGNVKRMYTQSVHILKLVPAGVVNCQHKRMRKFLLVVATCSFILLLPAISLILMCPSMSTTYISRASLPSTEFGLATPHLNLPPRPA